MVFNSRYNCRKVVYLFSFEKFLAVNLEYKIGNCYGYIHLSKCIEHGQCLQYNVLFFKLLMMPEEDPVFKRFQLI